MSGVDRRQFLKLSAATTALTALSGSIARAAEIAPASRTGTIEDVEHVVVLMQENRSFDHYFGSLRGVRGFGDPRPVTLPSGKSVWHQSNGVTDVLPFHPAADDLGMQFLQDLDHDWNGGHLAFNGGKYDRWVPAKTATTMAYLNRRDIPFHYALADAFTICDAYHCSFIGATDPNRYYMWTGFTGNDGTGGGPVLGNDEKGYGWSTYPERLEKAGVSWKIYQDAGDGLDAKGGWGWINDAYRGNYGDNSLLYFNNYRNAKPGDALYEKARTGTNIKAGGTLFDVLAADVENNRLPRVSWIAAPEAYTEHPNWPANYGAWYIAKVLDALTSNPAVWAKTALFITYDENDGFFDHVVPPYPPSSAAQGLSSVDVKDELHPGGGGYVAGTYGLGQRVPMLVVSPWSTGGYTCSEVFDHTSIIRFLETRFGVHEPNISPWRRAICGDLTSAFDFTAKNTKSPALPDTTGYAPPDRDRHPDYVPVPPLAGSMPVQERGSRRTRPLPYEPVVDASVNGGKITLSFTGGTKAGAQFYITAQNRGDGPWTYTTAAGKQLSDTWNTAYSLGAYDLTVHGPNGFLREFKGSAAAAEVTARHSGCNLVLRFTNAATATRHLEVTNAYGGSINVTVQPGRTITRVIELTKSKRWYDISVVSTEDSGYLRRFAGHVETGAPGVSDPAIRTA
ncbi:phospholipase C [Lentzea aerocolonigenes]|uniref:phospholipase C n=1 Tax=Lentzea aerocolonigenes TaxID=68170 RepID=A0A0F0H3K5_LENAE|nr:phospholipase C, phosphocholine-specific [Lentzea aerocolonigenes]KJK48213.1 phospholipase C [Lentzea aerocolonigenes]